MAPSPPAGRHRPAQRLQQLLPSLAALGLLLAMRQTGLGERLNLLAYDLATHLRPAPSGATTPVRIIGIDAGDLSRFGPLIPDGVLADAVERLERIGVRAIGLDLFCGQAVGTGWERLRHQAATNPRLVSITFAPDGHQAIPGTPPDRQAYADLYFDRQDGVLRRDLLHIHGEAGGQVSLPMRLLQVATGNHHLLQRLEREPARFASLTVGAGGYLPESRVSAPAYRQRMLSFHQPGSFPQWSLRSLLQQPMPEAMRRQLRGSLVLIGVVAPAKEDLFSVPFSQWRQREGERLYQLPGVEIHAHRLAALLALDAGQSPGIQAAPARLNTALLLVALVAGLALGEGVASLRRSFVGVALGLLLGVGAIGALLALGVWVDGALPLGAYTLMAVAAWTRRGTMQQIRGDQLERQGREVRTLFSRFVSNAVAQTLLEPREGAERGAARGASQRCNVTVLTSDLRGFSLLSQDHDPEVIVTLLNTYLAAMFEIIESHGGTIDEVLGDAILVLFGAPQPRSDHAEAAVACALQMQLAMERVNQRNRQPGLPALAMGIGLCSGEVIAGTIGSQRRAKYGVVGSAVNLAARIESFTVGGEVLADDSTVRAVPVAMRIDAVHHLAVKGAIEPLRVSAIGALAGAHNRALPLPASSRQALDPPIAVTLALVSDKRRHGTPRDALLTQLGERDAWLAVADPDLQPFTDVVVAFPGLSAEAYGKLREPVPGGFRVVWTVVPAEIKALLPSPGPSAQPGSQG